MLAYKDMKLLKEDTVPKHPAVTVDTDYRVHRRQQGNLSVLEVNREDALLLYEYYVVTASPYLLDIENEFGEEVSGSQFIEIIKKSHFIDFDDSTSAITIEQLWEGVKKASEASEASEADPREYELGAL